MPLSCAAASPATTCRAIEQRARHREFPVAAQHVGERLPFDEGHRQVLDALDVADVVNADDVLVRDLPREHELALEAKFEIARRRRVRLRGGPDHLDGDADAQLVIERLVDGAHAAGAEQFEDRVARADLIAGAEPALAETRRLPHRRPHTRRRRSACAGRIVAAGIGRIVAASTPPAVAAPAGELGVSNNEARMLVPQPAQNSASGGIARPHLEQKDADSMSVIEIGVLALWSFCQISGKKASNDAGQPVKTREHLHAV